MHIQQQYMQELAGVLDELLNGEAKGDERKMGFVLLTFPFGVVENGRVNYVGNGARDEVRAALKELLARWEGQYAEPSGVKQ